MSNYDYLLPQVPYYGPTFYTYLPTMNVNAAFPGMAPMQCMDSCCSINCSTPVTSAFLSSGGCTDSCCSGSPPTICVDSCCSDAPNIIINNPGSGGCMASCCSDAPDIIINNAGGMSYGMPSLYEDTCNITSTYYYSNKPSEMYRKDGKTYYNSYGRGYMMM